MSQTDIIFDKSLINDRYNSFLKIKEKKGFYFDCLLLKLAEDNWKTIIKLYSINKLNNPNITYRKNINAPTVFDPVINEYTCYLGKSYGTRPLSDEWYNE